MRKGKDGWELVAFAQYVDPAQPPKKVQLRNERLPGWLFTVRFGPSGDVLGFAIDEHDWRADERNPLNASFVHGVGVGGAISKARVLASTAAQFAAAAIPRRITGVEATAPTDEVGYRLVYDRDPEELRQWAALVSERTGTRGKDDVVFAQMASDYVRLVEAGERAPHKRLAEALNVSASKVRNHVYEARQRELLTATKQGAKGGRLTAKGRRVLDEEV